MENQKNANPNQFAEFLENTLNVLKDLMENIDTKPINPDAPLDKINQELVQIERAFDEFIRINNKVAADAKSEEETPTIIPKDVQRLLKKSTALLEQAEAKKELLEKRKKQLEKSGKEAPSLKTKKTSDKESARKNKFRRIGGSRGWKPL